MKQAKKKETQTSTEMVTPLQSVQTEIRDSLIELAAHHPDGILNPMEVVTAASNPDHALHRFFEWDDGAAADKFRLLQAGALIRRIKITVIRPQVGKPREIEVHATRELVSLPSNRTGAGGYQRIDAVLKDVDARKELVDEAFAVLGAARAKYALIEELAGVWAALDAAR